MITGAHFVLYSSHPEADRGFFREVLGLRSVDVGEGWLIFALPPAELGVHPSAPGPKKRKIHAGQEMAKVDLYLMCNDLHKVIRSLQAKNVECAEIDEATWGLKTTISLPSGSRLGLYQPNHPTAIGTNQQKGWIRRRQPGKTRVRA